MLGLQPGTPILHETHLTASNTHPLPRALKRGRVLLRAWGPPDGVPGRNPEHTLTERRSHPQQLQDLGAPTCLPHTPLCSPHPVSQLPRVRAPHTCPRCSACSPTSHPHAHGVTASLPRWPEGGATPSSAQGEPCPSPAHCVNPLQVSRTQVLAPPGRAPQHVSHQRCRDGSMPGGRAGRRASWQPGLCLAQAPPRTRGTPPGVPPAPAS